MATRAVTRNGSRHASSACGMRAYWRDPVYDGESISQEEHMYLSRVAVLKVLKGSGTTMDGSALIAYLSGRG